MSKFKTLEQVVEKIEDYDPFSSDSSLDTVEQLVDILIDIGNTDKVFVRHDDHLDLKDKLSKEFIRTELANVDKEKFDLEIKEVLEQANIIIPLSERVLSDSDLEEIQEDKQSRGEEIDD